MSSAGIIPSHSHFSYLSELVIVSKQHNFWSQTNPNRLSRSKCRQLKKKLPFSLSTFHIWSQSRCRSGRFMQIKKKDFYVVDCWCLLYLLLNPNIVWYSPIGMLEEKCLCCRKNLFDASEAQWATDFPDFCLSIKFWCLWPSMCCSNLLPTSHHKKL